MVGEPLRCTRSRSASAPLRVIIRRGALRWASLPSQTANMQDFQMKDLDWNDLRYILYASRTGRIASTAQMLGVNETTVARRIAHVERLLGARLFERNAGVLAPTDSGQLVISRAERIELDVDAVKNI